MEIQWTVCSKQNVIPLISSVECLYGTATVLLICPHCWHILIKLISMDVAGWHAFSHSFPNAYNIFGYLYIYLLRVLRFRLVLRHLLCICYRLGLMVSWTLRSPDFFCEFFSVACAFCCCCSWWWCCFCQISMTRWEASRGERITEKTFARSSLADSYSCKWNYLRK